MSYLVPVLALIGGIGLGTWLMWIACRARIASAVAQVKAELQPQLAALGERVEAKDQQITTLRAAAAVEAEEKSRLLSQLQEQGAAKASAEQTSKHLEASLELRARELMALKESYETERQKCATAAAELATVNAQLQAERKSHAELEQKLSQAEAEMGRLQGELFVAKRQNGELTEKAKYLEERLGTQREDLEALQQKFQKEFEAIAHKLLLENSSRFGQQSAESLGKVLAPFRENLVEFKAKLESVQQDTATQSALLKDQIARIGTEAANLSKALKGDVKVLGNWGENMLDQILERSGLQLGLHYRRQSPARSEAGEQRFLDVLVDLPEDKHLVIDSKVSLKFYEEYVNCSDTLARGRHLEAHIDCLRNHFRGLSAKRYQDLYGITAPDFVLMYVPIEGAFFLAVGQEPGLFSEALDKNVVLITNSTLLATLRTVAHVWRLADQQKNAVEIAERGGKLYDKFVGFIGDLQGIGSALGTAQEAWNEANKKLHQGAGNLVGQAEKLRALGVKASKKLPAQLTAVPGTEDEPALPEGNGKRSTELEAHPASGPQLLP